MENVKSDLIRGNIDTIILKCLKISDMYGLEIINHIKKASYDTYVLKQPTLYSALKRLEGKGYISSYWRDSAIGGRRHYYKLTEAGKESFVDKKDQWSVSKDVIDTIVDGKPAEKKSVETESPPIESKAIEDKPVESIKKPRKAPVLPIDDAPPVPATLPQTVTIGMAINPYNPYLEVADDYHTLPFRIIEGAMESPDNELDFGAEIIHASSLQLDEKDDLPPLLRYAMADATLAPVHTAPEPEPVNTFARYLSPEEYAAMTPVKTGASAKTAKIANYDIEIRPFVQHYSDKKRGDFHYIAKLRLMASFLITMVTIVCLVLAYHNLKPNTQYSADERFFFVLGYTAAAMYFIYYLVRFITAPNMKKAMQSQFQEHFIRLGACVGTVIAILAINILAGLTNVNSPDYLVFWVVPCILAAVIYVEGIVQYLLCKANLFVA